MANTKFSNGYALLIGVGGKNIEVTVDDATGLYNVLIDPSRAAYLPDQVELLTETEADREGILAGFDWLIEKVQSNSNATVIVYFSGHGIQIEQQNIPTEYFLLPHGYIPGERAKTAISGSDFTAKIEAIKARKLVVLLDCCHAAGMSMLKEPGEITVKSMNLPPALLNILDTGSGRVIVASSREDESSWTGTPYSVFTACLIEALNGNGATNKDGFARILNILTYLTDQVPGRAAPHSQHPFVNRIDNSNNFPLCYYAGGSKDIPSDSVPLSSRRRQTQKERYDMLLEVRKIPFERLRRLQKAWANERHPGIRHQLEVEIQEVDADLTRIDAELDEIERRLQ